jgi:N-acetylneuraminic acid mutarotase
MIVWGGCDAQTCGPGSGSDPLGLNNGGRYNPQTDSWQTLATTGAPTNRWNQTAVWSGSEMIVWGGLNGSGPFNTGGRYNPSTNTWTATATTGAPTARDFAHSVWTGTRMIVWGGYNSLLDQYFNTGGSYDPVANTWTATSTTGAPSGRSGHSLIWTGSEMIAWGGCNGANCQEGQNTGGRYNPQTNSWMTTSTIEAPSPRDVHSAVWTGTEMIVFGGEPCARCEPIYDTGGRYTAATGSVVDTVTITRAQYATQRSQLTVQATDSNPSAILTVSVTSTGVVLGNMTNKGGGSYTAKFTGIANPVNITVKSNLGASASAAVRAK